MATSTNYGWAEPDNTDLVTNGALAIRTLGNAIDTSLWNSGYGQAGKNKIINGDFGVNQRAFTSTTTTSTFGFDRFSSAFSDGTSTYSAQTFTAGAAPIADYEGTNFARLVSTGQTTSTALTSIFQKIEDVRTFAGQTVTISFFAKASTGTPNVAAAIWQEFGTGSTSPSVLQGSKIAITSSWARYSATFTMGSLSGKNVVAGSDVRVLLITSAGSARDAYTGALGIQSVTVDFWGVQVEYGAKATPFQTASGGSIQGELAMCQRYYWRFQRDVAQFGLMANTGYASTTLVARFAITLPTSMRVAPTSLENSNIAANRASTDTRYTSGTWALVGSTSTFGNSVVEVSYTHGSAVFAAGDVVNIQSTNTTTQYIALSAEF